MSKKNIYKSVECKRGREWILRVPTGSDVYDSIQQFAIDHEIRFAQIHTGFMGGFEPARFMIWTPDTRDPENWRNEDCIEVQNLSMLLSMSGFIHLRKAANGDFEPFPAVHYIVGAGWNVPTGGGHLAKGTIVKGNLEIFVTEVLGIDVIMTEEQKKSASPETWYKNI